MASVGRIVVLLWADIFAMYAMYMMMAYLTDVWKLGFTPAAAILNVFWGLVGILPLLLQFLVDTVMGNYRMLFISSISYSAGFCFLMMSTPQVLGNAIGTCSDYEPECVGNGQQALFYTSLAFIVIGVCGHLICWTPFMAEQVNKEEVIKEEKHSLNSFSYLTVQIITIVAVIALPYIKSWMVRFGIPIVFSLVANLVFLTGSCSYKYVRPQGSPLTTFVRVFVASTSKFGYSAPKEANELYENRNTEIKLVPHTRSLRCLDKAAIIVSSITIEEQQNHRWKLCTVTEVEETKTIIRMIPVWLTFIFCGIVSSIGFTYFIGQLNRLTLTVGDLEVPSTVLLWFYNLVKPKCNELYVKFTNSSDESGSRKIAPAIGVGLSMIFAILCCIIAAIVENKRLNVVQNHGLLDNPNATVRLNVFWLIPQFLLLAALDGIFYSSAVCFFRDQSPPSTKKYLPSFISGVFGVGILSSVLSVYIVGKISERGGKNLNWFQHDLNKSRLDKYYWTLAWLSAINLVIFIVVAIFYRYNESELQKLEISKFAEAEEPFEDDSNCCCCYCC